MRAVTLVEAPTSAGGYAPGQEVAALLEARLVERLEAAGAAVRRGGQRPPFGGDRTPTTPGRRTPMRSSTAPAKVLRLTGRLQPMTPIVVLGGDCTVGVERIARLQHRVERLGIIYVDRHADLNVPDSTVDGALDSMGMAHMLDIDGAVDGLAALTVADQC